jgi:hypothetical protein
MGCFLTLALIVISAIKVSNLINIFGSMKGVRDFIKTEEG